MHCKTTIATVLAAAAVPALAHMNMVNPAPLLFQGNDNTTPGGALDTYTAPLASRNDFPCKGQRVLDTIGTAQGAAVDTWSPGSSQTMTVDGGAFHGGGSCQLSLSYDRGSTFKVIKSFIGNCPTANGPSNYDFTVPSDAPESSDVVFAWTWFNHIGNREMYMNCAVVNIGSGSAKRSVSHEENQKRQASFDQRPNLFVANIDGSEGCRTPEGIDVEFPQPGNDVSSSSSDLGLYIDASKCQFPDSVGAGGAGNGGSSGAPINGGGNGGDDAPAPARPTTPAAAPAPSTTIPGGVFVTTPAEEEATSDAASATIQPIADPTTLSTSTKPAATTSTSAAPSAPSAPSPAPANPGVDAGAFAVGEPCSDEGMWNCIAGASFQRCASGQWSAVLQMAAGTTCSTGVSETFVINRKRGGARIFNA